MHPRNRSTPATSDTGCASHGLSMHRKFWLVSACGVSLLVSIASAIFGTGCIYPWGQPVKGDLSSQDPYTEQRARISTFHEAIVYWKSRDEQEIRAMGKVVESGLGMPFHQDLSHGGSEPFYLSPSGITSIRIGRTQVVLRGLVGPVETQGSVEKLAAALTAAARASGLQVR